MNQSTDLRNGAETVTVRSCAVTVSGQRAEEWLCCQKYCSCGHDSGRESCRAFRKGAAKESRQGMP